MVTVHVFAVTLSDGSKVYNVLLANGRDNGCVLEAISHADAIKLSDALVTAIRATTNSEPDVTYNL